MRIDTLDHVNLRTTKLEELTRWYEEVLGLTNGDRPKFPFPGAWLYAGEQAVIHLVGIEGEEGAGSDVALKLEHFSFRATGREAFETRLRSRDERFEKFEIGQTGIVAYNLWDPDGNHIHVDFAKS